MEKMRYLWRVGTASVAGLALVGLLLAWCASTESSAASAVPSRAGQSGSAALVSAGSEFTVCTAAGTQSAPAIYGDVVVWRDQRGGNGDIYGYDLSTGHEFTICTASGEQRRPAIYGDVVVWDDRRGADADIYGYDLRAGHEFTVSIASGDQGRLAIYGDVVVWDDWRGADADIYGYDLRAGHEFTVSIASGDQLDPAIYGDVVVWQDTRSGTDSDIYGRRIGFHIYLPIVMRNYGP